MREKKSKPLILITNDDGISAPGIRKLIRIMKDLGDVVVVAPDSPQSGMDMPLPLTQRCMSEKYKVWEMVYLNMSVQEHQRIV